jgi:aminoglycoside phosphotransferase (APT) family kinase protein
VRLDWGRLPARVRSRVEAGLGARVARAATRPGGFSPGVAAVLELDGGARVFCKAACPRPNPDTPLVHRRELAVLRALPAVAGVPRLLWSLDEGPDGWVVLVSEAVDGEPPAAPWRAAELERVVAALVELWAALTPSPLPAGAAPAAGELVARTLRGWGRVRGAGGADRLDGWSARHLDALAALEGGAAAAVAGDTLLHLDLRADNLLLTPDRVWVVDWPHACVGAAWFDLVCFAPSVAMQGGPAPEALVSMLPGPARPGPAALAAAVAALAGYFTERSLQPPPPGLPTLRAFQAAQAAEARAWLRRLTGWA